MVEYASRKLDLASLEDGSKHPINGTNQVVHEVNHANGSVNLVNASVLSDNLSVSSVLETRPTSESIHA